MNNILNYIDWRGDLTFQASPFNEVDNLIMSQLVYMNFSEVMGNETKTEVELSQVAEDLIKLHPDGIVSCGLMNLKDMYDLLKKAGSSRRFGSMKLFFPRSCFDEENQEQFYAITFITDDSTVYVAFRGTDQTLIGWQEDFNMGFICPVPSQLEAAEYLSDIAGLRSETLITGGHSKGGNLAVYSAAFAKNMPQSRISCIYSNDGPGFPENIIKMSEYTAIVPKVRHIIPQGSIVGMLLEHGSDYSVVKSTQHGISQHDCFSWEVMGNSLIKLDERDNSSIIVDKTLSQWITSLSDTERKSFVSSLFEVLSLSGAQKLEELPGDAVKLLKGIKTLEPQTKEVLVRAVKELKEQAIIAAKQFYIENRQSS